MRKLALWPSSRLAIALEAAAGLEGAVARKVPVVRLTSDASVKMATRRAGAQSLHKTKGFSGEELRRMRAEKGCGRPPKKAKT